MSTVIKGGTVVTADLTCTADVLVEGEPITAIGPDLKGDETLDATDAYVMPGGIDPHTHLEMPFMGTTRRRLRERHLRGGVGRHDDGGGLRAAGAGAVDRQGDGGLGQQVGAADLRRLGYHMAIMRVERDVWTTTWPRS